MLSLETIWSILAGVPETGGPLASRHVTSMAIDSRQVARGALFVAFRGEKQDGHAYVADAFRKGAVAALVSMPEAGGVRALPVVGNAPAQLDEGPICLQVPNVLAALQHLGATWRARQTGLRVVAVTGSVGKTSTKEAVAAVLRQRYNVLKSEANQNNEIGLPLNLLRLDSQHERAVVEMGMYSLGEIAHLCTLARPDIGVVTNVGPMHLERLGSMEAIAQAKSELPRSLPERGALVLNGDDAAVCAMADVSPARTVLTYGLGETCDLRAEAVRSHGLQGLTARFVYAGEAHAVQLPWVGRHNVYVGLAAAGVGIIEGLSWDEITAGLGTGGTLGRLKVVDGRAGAHILDDSYNASPAAMLADLDLLAELNGRRIAVLGDMLELGALEEQAHRNVGRRAAEVLAVLATVGKRARWIAEEAQRLNPQLIVRSCVDRQEAVAWLQPQLQTGDYVLVKGSRAMALEEVVAALRKESA